MAKKRLPLSGAEVTDIGAEIQNVSAGSEVLQQKLQAILMSSKRMSSGVAADFRKIHRRLISDTGKQEAQIRRMQRQQSRGMQINANQMKQMEAEHRANRRKVKILDRVNARTEQQSSFIRSLVVRMVSMISITGLLTAAWDALVSSFDNWIRLSQLMQGVMGQLGQTTGATAAQFGQMRGMVEQAAGSLGQITQEVDGIREGGTFVNEMVAGMRDLRDITPGVQRNLMTVSRALAGGTANATTLFRALEGIAPEQSLEEFSGDMVRFAESIGANAATMTQDFIAARSSIAGFGRDGIRVFRDVALMANQFHIENERLQAGMRGFDTFGGASQQVNQLNAMLGTSLSSFEMMMTTNPAERIELIRSELRNTGQEWQNMSYHQQLALAESVGLNRDEAARVFARGQSLEQMREAQQEAAAEEQSAAVTARSNQQIMARLLQQTSSIVPTLTRAFQILRNLLSDVLAPIFGEVNTGLIGIVERFGAWMRQITQSRQFREIVQDISKWIQEAFQWIQRHIPTWEEFQVIARNTWNDIQEGAQRAWVILQQVGAALQEGWAWLVEQKKAWDTGESSARRYWDFINDAADLFITIGTNMWNIVKGMWETWVSITEAVGEFIFTISGARAIQNMSTMISGINDTFSSESGLIANATRFFGIISSAQSPIEAIQNILSGNTPTTQINPASSEDNSSGAKAGRVQEAGRQAILQESVATDIAASTTSMRAAEQRVKAVERAAREEVTAEGATATAPVTDTTTSAPSRAPSGGSNQVSVVASDVTLNGRTVGRALFEISQRT